MKDYLQDIITHTQSLGEIDLIKVTGTDKVTQINAVAENRSVILEGTFKTPSPDFIGTFGMPNLGKLKTILGFDDIYDDDANISMTRVKKDNEEVPASIHFETKNGDFVNDYRLMSKAIVEEKVRTVSFKGAKWTIEFEPSVVGIQRLKKQATANSDEEHFTTSVVNGDLKISFGDVNTHSGSFVFEPKVNGTLARPLVWPVKVFQAILDLQGDKKIKISDQSVAEITVDSGLAVYRFLLPANAK